MRSAISSEASWAPSRFRWINSAGLITGAGGRSRVDDSLARHPANGARGLEPGADRGSDVGELAGLVELAVRVAAFDIREQQRVLARVVGRRRRRIAAVVGRQDQEVVLAERVQHVGQSAVEILQAAVEVDGIVAM